MKKVYPKINNKQLTLQQKKMFNLFEKEIKTIIQTYLQTHKQPLDMKKFQKVIAYNAAFIFVLTMKTFSKNKK